MLSQPVILNPLGWVQSRLVGGPRRIVGIAAVYAAAIFGFSVLIYRAAQPDITLTTLAQGAMTLIVIAQIGIFFLVGTSAIRKAIHRDFTSDMITSHRLTAMSGHAAVIGYLTGATSQVFTLTFVNWIAINIFALIVGIGPSQPLMAPTLIFLVLGVLALLCWTLTVLVALASRGKMGVTGLLIVLAVAANLGAVSVLPGLDLILVTLPLGKLTDLSVSGLDSVAMVVGLLAQLLLTLVLFAAAARKFARDDVPAFTPAIAYVLLALCTLIGCVALRFGPDSTPRGPIGNALATAFGMNFEWAMKLFFTLLAVSLIACLAVAAAARRSGADDVRRIKDDRLNTPPPRSYLEAPIVVTLIVFFIMIAVLTPILDLMIADLLQKVVSGRLLAMPVSFLLAMFTAAAMMYFGFRAAPGSAWVAVALYLILGWVIPPMADLAWEALSDPIATGAEVERTVLFSMSPVGSWLIVIRDIKAPLAAGLAVQTVVAIGALYLAYRAARQPIIEITHA